MAPSRPCRHLWHRDGCHACGTAVVHHYTIGTNPLSSGCRVKKLLLCGRSVMSYVMSAIIRRRLAEEKNPETRETLRDLLTLVEPEAEAKPAAASMSKN